MELYMSKALFFPMFSLKCSSLLIFGIFFRTSQLLFKNSLKIYMSKYRLNIQIILLR